MDERLKVALVVNAVAPYRLPVYDALAERVDLTVFAEHEHRPHKDWRVDLSGRRWRSHRYKVPSLFIARREMTISLPPPRLARDLAQLDPDCVVAGGYSNFPFWMALGWARLRRRPLVLWLGTTADSAQSRSLVVTAAKRLFFAQCDAVVTYGEDATRFAAANGCAADRVVTSLNVGDVEGMAARVSSMTPRTSDEPTRLLYVGQLIPRKGVDLLLEALRDVERPWQLRVVGEGSHRAEYESLAARSVPGRVTFTGYRTGDDLMREYAQADAFVLPSLREPASIVVSEALAAGLVVVGSAHDPTARALVNHSNGVVVDPSNRGALSGAVCRALDLVERSDRAALRQQISDNALRRGTRAYAADVLHAVEIAQRGRNRRGREAEVAHV